MHKPHDNRASTIVSDFNFKRKTRKIDWNAIDNADETNMKLETLKPILDNVIFSQVRQEDIAHLTDSNQVKMFKLMQMSLELMAFEQDALEKALIQMEQDYKASFENCKKADQKYRVNKKRLEELKTEHVAKKAQITNTQTNMLQAAQTSAQMFECPLCEECFFKSKEKLKNHVFSHHQQLTHANFQTDENVNMQNEDMKKQIQELINSNIKITETLKNVTTRPNDQAILTPMSPMPKESITKDDKKNNTCEYSPDFEQEQPENKIEEDKKTTIEIPAREEVSLGNTQIPNPTIEGKDISKIENNQNTSESDAIKFSRESIDAKTSELQSVAKIENNSNALAIVLEEEKNVISYVHELLTSITTAVFDQLCSKKEETKNELQYTIVVPTITEPVVCESEQQQTTIYESIKTTAQLGNENNNEQVQTIIPVVEEAKVAETNPQTNTNKEKENVKFETNPSNGNIESSKDKEIESFNNKTQVYDPLPLEELKARLNVTVNAESEKQSAKFPSFRDDKLPQNEISIEYATEKSVSNNIAELFENKQDAVNAPASQIIITFSEEMTADNKLLEYYTTGIASTVEFKMNAIIGDNGNEVNEGESQYTFYNKKKSPETIEEIKVEQPNRSSKANEENIKTEEGNFESFSHPKKKYEKIFARKGIPT